MNLFLYTKYTLDKFNNTSMMNRKIYKYRFYGGWRLYQYKVEDFLEIIGFFQIPNLQVFKKVVTLKNAFY